VSVREARWIHGDGGRGGRREETVKNATDIKARDRKPIKRIVQGKPIEGKVCVHIMGRITPPGGCCVGE
jgi:hypothetical protein